MILRVNKTWQEVSVAYRPTKALKIQLVAFCWKYEIFRLPRPPDSSSKVWRIRSHMAFNASWEKANFFTFDISCEGDSRPVGPVGFGLTNWHAYVLHKFSSIQGTRLHNESWISIPASSVRGRASADWTDGKWRNDLDKATGSQTVWHYGQLQRDSNEETGTARDRTFLTLLYSRRKAWITAFYRACCWGSNALERV